jgi:uncharacterized protein (TIGR03435 family)
MRGQWIASLFFSVCAIYAQQRPAFEVASVRPAAPPDQAKIAAALKHGGKFPAGAHVDSRRAEYIFTDLRALIGLAWHVESYRVEGPEWMASTRFDIRATLPRGASKRDAPRMLQSLLEDRFGVVVHREKIERPVLALVVGKGGLKLKASPQAPVPIDENAPLKPGELTIDSLDGPVRMRVDMATNTITQDFGSKGILSRRDDPATRSVHLKFRMTSMSGLATMLSQIFTQLPGSIDRPVVDMTGIEGYYDGSLDVALADMGAMAKSGGSDRAGGVIAVDPNGGALPLTEAIQELGLKLESRTAPVEQLIVDHVEKTPTGN